MSERWSLVRVIFRSKNILFHGPKVTGKKVLLHGHIAEGKSGLGYWLLSQTGQVEQPPLLLDIPFTGKRHQYWPPLLDCFTGRIFPVSPIEYSPVCRWWEYGGTEKQGKWKSRHILGCSLYLETTPILTPCFGLMERLNILQFHRLNIPQNIGWKFPKTTELE